MVEAGITAPSPAATGANKHLIRFTAGAEDVSRKKQIAEGHSPRNFRPLSRRPHPEIQKINFLLHFPLDKIAILYYNLKTDMYNQMYGN